METLFGLPAHPLIVHAAVVLIPLAAIGTVLIAVWPKMRRTIGGIVVILALLGFVSAFLARESGEPLEEAVEDSGNEELIDEHAELGETASLFAFLVVLGSGAVWGLDRYARSQQTSGSVEANAAPTDAAAGEVPGWVKPAATVASAAAVILAVVATYDIVQVGHSGAEATWDDVSLTEGEGEEDEGSEAGE
ncbi:MAG: hypothetical protein MUF83_02085 [Acidimicrobiales bacterium]|jgi:hypothetical protein|nr:hypothetical protein [Acidimicrobiales bacterium]